MTILAAAWLWACISLTTLAEVLFNNKGQNAHNKMTFQICDSKESVETLGYKAV